MLLQGAGGVFSWVVLLPWYWRFLLLAGRCLSIPLCSPLFQETWTVLETPYFHALAGMAPVTTVTVETVTDGPRSLSSEGQEDHLYSTRKTVVFPGFSSFSVRFSGHFSPPAAVCTVTGWRVCGYSGTPCGVRCVGNPEPGHKAQFAHCLSSFPGGDTPHRRQRMIRTTARRRIPPR